MTKDVMVAMKVVSICDEKLMVAAVNIPHAIDESNIAEKPEAKCRIVLMYCFFVREKLVGNILVFE